MLVVPGKWSQTTVQFLVTSSSDVPKDIFYDRVVRSSPYRKRKEAMITHNLVNNITFSIYTNCLAYSAVNLFKDKSVRPTYNESHMQNAYDTAIGYIPRIAQWVTHSAIKKNHRSIHLDKQLVNKLKMEDSMAVNMVSFIM